MKDKINSKYIILAILIILGITGLFLRFTLRKDQKQEKFSAIYVRVIQAVPQDGMISLNLPGYLVADQVTPVLSRANGYLKMFYVDIGDHVEKGQILCELDVPDLMAEWKQAQADLSSAIAKREIAEITTRRWSGLYQYDQESISKQEVDVANADYEYAVSQVKAAESNLKRLEVLMDFRYVRAPFDGFVVERNIDIGSLVSIGNESMTQPYQIGYETVSQPLFKISNLDILRVFVDVPQPFYPNIKEGVEAKVIAAEYRNQPFHGVIDRDAVSLDQSSRTLLTQVNIENKDHILRPGMYVEVNFSFKPYRETFNIPVGALIIRNGPPTVAILNESNTIEIRDVEIGKDYGKSLQIVNGIKKGDRIVANPNYKMKPGVKVEVIAEKDPKDNKR